MSTGGILAGFWWVGEAEGPSEGLRDEFLAFLAPRDGNLGDGGAVFRIAVEEHAKGRCGGNRWEGGL